MEIGSNRCKFEFALISGFVDDLIDCVYRSPIDRRGLFCKRKIEASEMVIEYAGSVIRGTLTDKREKYYDGKVRFIFYQLRTNIVCL